ncbi:MAG: polysaccharide biosynthesis tyrosine autokinase [Sphingomonas adhaesiva]|uniref:GumC family protein n=1 Tax=Sphingomonas adhaesiva TaxID=28212 RepID=UPI002FFCAF27
MATMTDNGGQDYGFQRTAREKRSLLPDPKYVLMIFRRRLWLFLAVAALAAAAVIYAVMSATPVYMATASVLIEPGKTEVIDLGNVVQGLPADSNVVDTEARIIGSPTVGLAVVRQLHLDRDPAFVGAAAPGAAPAIESAGVTAAERRATAAVLGRVTVRRAGLTYVIDITAQSSDPSEAVAIANAFAQQFIALQAARKMDVSENAAAFVSKRADELRAQAVADDAAVQRYMIANNLMSAQGATMAEQEVSSLNQQIAQARAELASERGKLAAARGQLGRGGGGADIGAVLSSDTIRQLRGQEAQASAELAALQSRYGELYPDVQKAKQNLADVRDQITAERQRIISTLQANVQVAASRLASLEGSEAQSRGALAANSSAQVGLLELQRKAEASKTIYSAFLQRAKETAATSNLPQADASISSLARLPDSPSWPNRRLGAIAALGLGVLLGLVAIAVAEYLDNSIGTREDVVSRLDAPYAGAIPDLNSVVTRDNRGVPPHVYVLSHPFSAFAEALRTIGAFTLGRAGGEGEGGGGGGGGGRVVAITSPLPREGKTTLSICLARVLAMGNRRVVLIDADLRRHSVSDMIVPGQGERLLKVLSGEMRLEDALVKDEATGLMVLPTAGITGTQDFLVPERVTELYARLKREFDVVIVDTAPLLGVVDTRVLTRFADATLLITRWRKTAIKAGQAALDMLDEAGANVAGVALSQVDVRQYASTGHADTYGYYKKFTGYYVN